MDLRKGERRKHTRLEYNLPSKLFKLGLQSGFSGVTENVSPMGALIKTRNWNSFQPQDHALITLFIPSAFSGQDEMTSIVSDATIVRVDKENEAVAVEFSKALEQLERK
jgi:hypothetical protein